jgi:ribonuclease BN (tRNA processing enzyme)
MGSSPSCPARPAERQHEPIAVTIRFLGSGDAVGSGGRFQACILVSHAGGKILLDAGASSIVALKREGLDPSAIDVILVSHLHGDHFAGIPFLILDGQFAHRARPLTIIGPVGSKGRIEAALVNMYPGFARELPHFPLRFVELGDRETAELEQVRVAVWSVPHDPLSNPLALRLWIGPLSIGYSGDTAWTGALAEVADRTELFICEAQTLEPKARIHLSYAEVLAHRHELATARLVLTHLGRDVIAANDLELERAWDGMAIKLGTP